MYVDHVTGSNLLEFRCVQSRRRVVGISDDPRRNKKVAGSANLGIKFIVFRFTMNSEILNDCGSVQPCVVIETNHPKINPVKCLRIEPTTSKTIER